ncbi:MAG TPA: ribosome biogenesis GTP-binding protein YihA/YsxC [Steroidobacteraceae bacterium]|jgi:GTP-binding protein|nr:ribosome biogenesis GTP-binding protein YihA/YsxC [Steroidobacteraceae bacterium]
MSIYPGARFLISAAAPTQFPTDFGHEVAFAGRSNSGKSTAINALTARRALARTSKTPGRTRLINFFELATQQRIVDLPGYGYAEGPPTERDTWKRLIEALGLRSSLQGLFLVVDSRRGLMAGDEQLLAWASDLQKPIHVLLSKSDQLKRSEARVVLLRTERALQDGASVQLFSARDGTGVEAARNKLNERLLNDALP